MNYCKNSLSCWCVFDVLHREYWPCICVFLCLYVLQVFIPIYRGFERRWEFSRYINLSCLKLWFFTIDLLSDLIIVLWRTNFKSIPYEKEQCLQQCYCYSCLDVETKLQRWWLQCSWLYTVLCQLWWSSFWLDASDNHCFWWPCFWWRVLRSSIFRLVSSDALLQTHSSRRFKLHIKFLCSLTCSIRIFMNSTLIKIMYTWNKCLAYPIDYF